MPIPKVYADFHHVNNFNRLTLTCAGTKEDLDSQGIELREGLVLIFSMDDADDDQGQPDELLVDGVVHYDEAEHSWVAAVDWSAIRHASDVQGSNSKNSGSPDSAVRSETRRIL
jgi:hypothetical protein